MSRNPTLRNRFGIEAQNSAMVSRVISDAISAKVIRCYDDRYDDFSVLMIEDFSKDKLTDVRLKNTWHKLELFRKYFYKLEWYEVYDFIEFFISKARFGYREKDEFIRALNDIFRIENSGYTIIADKVMPITDEA